MLVSELINKLSTFPLDAKVEFQTSDGLAAGALSVEDYGLLSDGKTVMLAIDVLDDCD